MPTLLTQHNTYGWAKKWRNGGVDHPKWTPLPPRLLLLLSRKMRMFYEVFRRMAHVLFVLFVDGKVTKKEAGMTLDLAWDMVRESLCVFSSVFILHARWANTTTNKRPLPRTIAFDALVPSRLWSRSNNIEVVICELSFRRTIFNSCADPSRGSNSLQ